MKISVVLCTHNPNRELLRRCLEHLRRQRDVPCEVELIIVDNASNPPLVPKELRLGDFSHSARIVQQERLGLSFARERGTSSSTGDLVVFVDDDNLLDEDYLLESASFFKANPQAGAIGGRIRALCDFALPDWFGAVSPQLAICDRGDAPKQYSNFGWETPAGAGIVIRRETLTKVLQDPLVLVGRRGGNLSSGEDVEICFRVRSLGWHIWYVPALQMDHVIPSSRLELPYLKRLFRHSGHSIPFLEFYLWPHIHWRRIMYVRRARYEWNLARESSANLKANKTGPGTVADLLNVEMLRGKALGYLTAALGPPSWQIAQKYTRK